MTLCFVCQCVHKICTEDSYREWRRELENHATKTPYDQQWLILDTVHERCVLEYKIEQSLTDAKEDMAGPLLRLIHGLPGSGKARTFLNVHSAEPLITQPLAWCTASSVCRAADICVA